MSAVTGVVLASLGASFALVAIAWLTCSDRRAALQKEVGGATWDFSKSWASNVTVVGAILGTVLSAKILPASPTVIATPNGYTALSLLFGALVVVAPLVFTALRSGRPSAMDTVIEGKGWAFLLASEVTLWGVIGELATVGLILYEAKRAHTLPLGAVLPTWCVIGGALLLIGIYGFRTTHYTVDTGTPAPKGFVPGEPRWNVL
jgi:hypothetical protein